jgi:hypothetical protein
MNIFIKDFQLYEYFSSFSWQILTFASHCVMNRPQTQDEVESNSRPKFSNTSNLSQTSPTNPVAFKNECSSKYQMTTKATTTDEEVMLIVFQR